MGKLEIRDNVYIYNNSNLSIECYKVHSISWDEKYNMESDKDYLIYTIRGNGNKYYTSYDIYIDEGIIRLAHQSSECEFYTTFEEAKQRLQDELVDRLKNLG